MACYNIKIGNTQLKITNSDEKSDVNNASDFKVVESFLLTGKLNKGYQLYDASGNEVKGETNILELYNTLKSNIKEHKSNKQLTIDLLTNKDEKEFINKLVGNRHTTSLLPDYSLNLNYNILVNKNWASSQNWFGFTKNRFIMITGNNWYYNSVTAKNLAICYQHIRNNNEKYINIVNKLYQKFYPVEDGKDVYEKLTWLANNATKDLMMNIYTPYNSRYKSEKNKSLISEIKANQEKFIGTYFKYNDQLYIFKKIKNDKEAIATNLESKHTENISLNKIRSLYYPISIYHNNTSYQLIGNIWYDKNNNPISEELSNQLFNEYYDVSDNYGFTISLYNDNIKSSSSVIINQSENRVNILEALSDSALLYTPEGIFSKVNDKWTSDGQNNIGPDTVIKGIRSINTDDQHIIMNIKDLNEKEEIITPSHLRLVLYDHFGIIDFSDIIISYEDKIRAAQVYIPSSIDRVISYKIKLNGNMTKNARNFNMIQLAINFKNYLDNNPEVKLGKTIAAYYNDLVDIIIDGKENKSNINESIISELSQNIDRTLSNEDSFDKYIENNRLMQSRGQDNTFYQELVKRGFIIASCEI